MSYLLAFSVFFPMAAAGVSYLIGRYRKDLRDCFADAVTVITFGVLLFLAVSIRAGHPAEALGLTVPAVCGFGLHFALDGFRALYSAIAAFMWMMTTLFSGEYFARYRNRNRYYFFLLLTLGATIGVFLSADFFTTFLFFEIMSFTSYVWVTHDERKESLRAAGTYLAVAVIGGLVMLMGIFLLDNVAGTLMFDELVGLSESYELELNVDITVPGAVRKLWAAGICMLFGFGAKAGAFPMHIWLPKAHPVAPAPASALLSGILTKAGIFGILVLGGGIFLGSAAFGSLILILGVCTMVLGAVLALFSVDLKRTLACSSVSQIGFILVGVGMSGLLGEENALAARGALLHMVNHSLIKLALFMAAGVVFMNVHRLDLNDIRGFGRNKPLLNYVFLMGALGIGGIPLWNGYVSKTLIHESIVEYAALLEEGTVSGMFSPGAVRGIEWCFLISGGLTVAYMAKLYVALFVEKNGDAGVQEEFDSRRGTYMNRVSACVLAFCGTLLPVMGFFPGVVMNGLADMGQGFLHVQNAGETAYFSLENLRGSLVSLGIGALVYAVVVRRWMMRREEGREVYLNRQNPYLDLENLIYRPILLRFLPFVLGVACRLLDSLVDTAVVVLRKTVYRDSRLPHELTEGTMLTHALGCFANGLERIANATVFRKHKKKVDYEHKYALIYEELTEDTIIIRRSLSFGLLLFCGGLLITVGYLLFSR